MTATFRADAHRHLAEGVAVWDVYLEAIAQMVDPRHSPPLTANGAWAKGGDSGPTVSAKDPVSARAELEKLAHECTYSFTSLRADDETSVTVYTWLESRRVQVSLHGPQEARIEGLRAVAQRFLDRFPESNFTPRIELNGVVLGVTEQTRLPSKRRTVARVLAEHTKAIWFGVAGTVVGGVLLAVILRAFGLGGTT